MKIKFYLILLSIVQIHIFSFSQTERKNIRSGNNEYQNKNFTQAEVNYRKALEKNNDLKWKFNLGDALFKQENYTEAEKTFSELATESNDTVLKSMAYYNLGNTSFAQQDLDKAIENYKKSLRINPKNMAAKYNLAVAQRLKNQNQQQNQENKQDQNDKQEEKEDQKKEENSENKENQEQEKQEQQEQKISKQDAERMLEAIDKEDKKNQEEIKKKLAIQNKIRIEKDW